MGVRLYPVGVADDVLEILAGVPEGTAARLKALIDLRSTMNDDAWYDKLYEDSDLHCLSSFDVFGWGKLTGPAFDFIRVNEWDENVGCASGRDALELLMRQGVSIPEGVKPFDVTWN
jgi:hypothetical protein